MKLYAGIDLLSNNGVVVVLDEQDRVLVERRQEIHNMNGAADRLEKLSDAAGALVGWRYTTADADVEMTRLGDLGLSRSRRNDRRSRRREFIDMVTTRATT